MHTNSIEGEKSFHGRRTLDSRKQLLRLLGAIQAQYGDVNLHRIRRIDALEGVAMLEPEGLRAMLQPEVVQGSQREGRSAVSLGDRVSLVSLNVDALGSYDKTPAARITTALGQLLDASPDVILLQEVSLEMYRAAQAVLVDWQLYYWRQHEEDYFLVTAVRGSEEGRDDCRVVRFGRRTRQGRHLLVVRRGRWSFTNAHTESGSGASDRDNRQWQLDLLSRRADLDPTHVQVVAGDLNVRKGEEQCLRQEGWDDAWEKASTEA